MKEVILTLILVSPQHYTTTTYNYDPLERTCEEAGEELVGEWINTPSQRYVVTGYACNAADEPIEARIYPKYNDQ